LSGENAGKEGPRIELPYGAINVKEAEVGEELASICVEIRYVLTFEDIISVFLFGGSGTKQSALQRLWS
jgi:hypothetical protein